MTRWAFLVFFLATGAFAQFEEIPLPVMPGNPSFENIIGYRALSIPPDGSVWVTGIAGQMRIDGATAPLVEPAYPWGANDAVVGDDGAIWIAHDLGLRRRNPSTLELTQINSMFLTEIEREPGGALWLVQYVSGSGAVHRYIPSSGAMESFPLERLPNTSLFLGDALWVLITDETGPSHKVIRITPSGARTEFSVPEAGAFVPATDGRIWVIGMTTFTRITPTTGEVATYPSPIPQTRYPNFSAKGVSFAVAPDGAIWIAHMGGLARLQDEWITNYATPELPPGGFFRPSYRPSAAFGADGRLAFIDRYVICCRILPTIPGPPVPGGVVRRVNVAALTGGQTAHIGNADVPFASPLALTLLGIALAGAAGVVMRR